MCLNQRLILILDLSKTPAANAMLKDLRPKTVANEPWFPLKVVWCKNCSLVQLQHVVDPEFLFKDYVYVSSVSPANLKHFGDFALHVAKKFKLPKKSLVVDIGSNDGILLRPFQKLGMEVVGVEPARNIARRANFAGITTVPKFFDFDVAKAIRRKYPQAATVITATNVFAHVDDVESLVKAVKVLLDDEGLFIVEAPYVVDLLKKNTFDLIYHEHLSHLGVRPLKVLFERLGMKIIRVEHNESHGGSIRVFTANINAKHKIHASVAKFLSLEKQMKLHTLLPYHQLAKRIQKNKQLLRALLEKIKKNKKTIVGYGASAKSATLLNCFGIDIKIIDYIVDDSKYKQGLFTPGTHLKVEPTEKIYIDKPDYLLLLAWNFAKPIMKTHKKYKELGGKFILPVPVPKIID